ncbi:MAG: hypothetical protein K0R15_1145 [Clostridiales bacterium]|jgi:two-component system chemotaxis response regulator CheB|nr:hypothetical protein [Clostridiales bacterium]
MEIMKKFVIIDDSALMRRVISDIIKISYKNALVTTAIDGLDGYNLLSKKEKPDVVILDINMPRMSGLELLEKLKLINYDVPILIVSTVALEGAVETIKALELGALDFVTKPGAISETLENKFSEKLLEKVNMALSICKKVESPKPSILISKALSKEEDYKKSINNNQTKLIALCCSTGGPKALQLVIPKLKKNMDAAMLLVQHMPAGFTKSLANRLNELSEVEVKEAVDGEIIQKGVVYIAKGGEHMQLQQKGNNYALHLNSLPARDGLRPCANMMYESILNISVDEVTCVVLTGMGSDGTEGIKKLVHSKKVHLIAQDAASSVVYGMPKAIYDTGLVNEVVTLDKIADTIMKKVGVR